MYWTAFLFPKEKIGFILWSLILFAFYLFILYLIREIKKEDLVILKNLISRKKKEELEEEFSENELGG